MKALPDDEEQEIKTNFSIINHNKKNNTVNKHT